MSEKYALPPGMYWRYIGDCSCRGADGDHTYEDSQWEVIDVDGNVMLLDEDGNVIRPAKKLPFWRRVLKALTR